MADYTTSRQWAKGKPLEYLTCRGRRAHHWTQTDRYIVPMGVDEYGNHYGGYYLVTEECPSDPPHNGCGMTREKEIDYRGDLIWKSDPYRSKPDYLSDVGRVDAAACVAEQLSRYELPTLLGKRPPHRTGYTPIPSAATRRKRA